jgi:hypothetical protein
MAGNFQLVVKVSSHMLSYHTASHLWWLCQPCENIRLWVVQLVRVSFREAFFSNPAFEERVTTGAHVASVTWTFCDKHYLCYGNVCAVNSSLSEIRREWDNNLRVRVCISYIACRMNSTRSLKIKIRVIRSQRFCTPTVQRVSLFVRKV